MSKVEQILALIIAFFFILVLGYYISPSFRAAINKEMYAVQKADDATNYTTLKKVEDTCRAMIASYDTDVLTWEQYKNSEGEQRAWADQARMRANKTAATYNAYILQNSFVWADNVPNDIRQELPIVGEGE